MARLLCSFRILRELTDEQLLALVAADNKTAFDELHRRWHGRVLVYLLRRSADYHVAEDACAETFITLWRRREKLQRSGRPPASLIFSTAKWTLHQSLWKRKRSGRFVEMIIEPVVAAMDPEEIAGMEERAYQVRLGIDRLKPKQAEAAAAVWLGGESPSSFGRLAGRTTLAVNESLYYALRNLQADKTLAALV
jgi:RNA polymerase sigma-70 factor, ECF subfamily